jgi:DNA-binding CsgD family transcriptional regulator
METAVAIVGRDRELGLVDRFLADVREGPAALVLAGEPGIGKSTVWAEALARATEVGFRVLQARPGEREARLAFSVLADLVEPILGEALAELPGPQSMALEVALLRSDPGDAPLEWRAVAAATLAAVRQVAEDAPVVIAVDDVQWVDETSEAVLAYVARRLGESQVGLLLGHRVDVGHSPPLALGQAFPEGRLRVEFLRPLSLGALGRLLVARTELPQSRPLRVRLAEVSGGNPLFALELARALEREGSSWSSGDPLPIPGSLQELVAGRVGRLTAKARRGLLVAAALSQPTVALVRTIADTDLDEAEDAGVVTIEGGRVRFAHPLLASSVYSSAGPAELRRLHRQLADHVDELEERAKHLALSAQGPDAEVAELLERAASSAHVRGAPQAAAELSELARALTPADATELAARRSVDAADYLVRSGEQARAREVLERVVPTLPDGAERARALILLALIAYYKDAPGVAVGYCREALAAAGDDPLLAAEIHCRIALVAEDDFELGERSAEAAVALLEETAEPPPDLLACALLERAYMRFFRGRGLSHEDVARATELLDPSRTTWPAVRARAVLESWAKYTDDFETARLLLEAHHERALTAGEAAWAASTLAHLAEVECWLGDWASAERCVEECEVAAAELSEQHWPLYPRALLAACTGDVDEARRSAGAGVSFARSIDSPWMEAMYRSVLGFLELSLGDARAADAELSRAAALVDAMGLAEPARFRFQADEIDAAVELDELSRAKRLVDRLEERNRIAPRPWLAAVSARSRGLVLAAEADLDGALQAFAEALTAHERLPMPLERGRTLLALGKLHRRRKEKTRARETLEEAAAIFEDLGARLWSERTAEELARLGLRRGDRTALTPTEERVARLAAEGLTNREIAATAFMSVKTVEANLSRSFRKLRIRSRAQLGAHLPPQSRPGRS